MYFIHLKILKSPFRQNSMQNLHPDKLVLFNSSLLEKIRCRFYISIHQNQLAAPYKMYNLHLVVHLARTQKKRTHLIFIKWVLFFVLGNVLLFQNPAVQVPSTLEGLTVVFEMGTRGSPPPSSPNIFALSICLAYASAKYVSSERTCSSRNIIP
jgi:hypothetical protein